MENVSERPNQAKTLQRLGATLHYWLAGAENTPLVVFTHGATLDHHMFDEQIAPLCAAGYRVLTWDMRGHGLSKPMGTSFALRTAADDLLAILKALACSNAVLIGHSFGGFVTQDIAFRHPEKVAAVGVIGCTDLTQPPSRAMGVALKLLPYFLPLSSVESFRKRTVENVSAKAAIRHYAYGATSRLSKAEFIEVILAGVACLAADNGYGKQSILAKPFLLTHGSDDKANKGIFPKNAPAWAGKEPFCTYRVIEHAGHTANQDNPEMFNKVLLEFLHQHVPVR